MQAILRLIEPTSGALTVHGDTVSGPRQDVGMMFQKATLLDWRTAVENVLLPTEIRGKPNGKDKEHALDLLLVLHAWELNMLAL